jgi:hypothetical protein
MRDLSTSITDLMQSIITHLGSLVDVLGRDPVVARSLVHNPHRYGGLIRRLEHHESCVDHYTWMFILQLREG